MGLVRALTLDDGTLTVIFALTFAGCTMAPHFTPAAAAALAGLPGVSSVATSIDTDFVLTPDLIKSPAPKLSGTLQTWRTSVSRG